MAYTEEQVNKRKAYSDKMRAIALARGYKPPSQKGIKRKGVWNKGKKIPAITGEKNYLWKGDNAGYVTMHAWVRRHKGKPEQCTGCGIKSKSPRHIQWANVDHHYRRDLDDYIALCVKCHRAHDKNL